jgi:hypothetical protein
MALSSVKRIPGEPIMISTFTGQVLLEDTRQSTAATLDFIRETGGPVHVIADLTDIQASFMETLMILRDQAASGEGTTSDPNVLLMLVGSHTMVKLFADAMSQPQFGGIQIPMFKSIEDALAAARVEIAHRGAADHEVA